MVRHWILQPAEMGKGQKNYIEINYYFLLINVGKD